ncbi:hypothetical protein [Microbispora sp. NPDC049125]|uniref:hypothetical protein n=1 Tax=Microbispora sp. NPDC049125 TaxID=3154929 RepID=UPI00346733E5
MNRAQLNKARMNRAQVNRARMDRARATGARIGEAPMTGVLLALTYASRRSTGRQIREFARSPIRILVVLALLGGLAALEATGLPAPEGTALPSRFLAAGLSAVLGVTAALGALHCPVRLRAADVAWLVPLKEGPRALVLYKIVSLAATSVVIGLVGGLAGRLLARSAEVDVVSATLSLALAATAFRVVSYLPYMLVTHGVRRVPLAVGLFALGAGAAVATVALGGAAPLAVFLPSAGGHATATATALMVVVLLAALTVGLADRYQDAAARLAWEMEAMRAALQRDGTSLAEMAARRLRRGVPSLAASPRFAGEAAFVWRAFAQLRRTWRGDLAGVLPVAAASAVAALWAGSGVALLPTAVAALLALLQAGSTGLADELDRTPFLLAPGRLGRQVLAVEVLPALAITARLVLVWLPVVVLGRGLDLSARLGVLPALPGLAALVVAASSAAAARTRAPIARLGLTVAAGAVIALVAALADLVLPAWPGLPFLVICLAAAAGLHLLAVRSLRRLIPGERAGRTIMPGTA